MARRTSSRTRRNRRLEPADPRVHTPACERASALDDPQAIAAARALAAARTADSDEPELPPPFVDPDRPSLGRR
jgi:hypothetical protein